MYSPLLWVGWAVQAVRRLVSDECGDMVMNLHDAAENGDVAEVRRLVAAGAEVEALGEHGARPLHVAAGYGHVEVMRVLVELGADKDAKAAHGMTPLHLTTCHGQVEAIKALVELGADKDAKTVNGRTPLHSAAHFGHVEAMRVLEELGANKDAKDVNGQTPMHLAEAGGHYGAAELSDVNAPSVLADMYPLMGPVDEILVKFWWLLLLFALYKYVCKRLAVSKPLAASARRELKTPHARAQQAAARERAHQAVRQDIAQKREAADRVAAELLEEEERKQAAQTKVWLAPPLASH
jgi:hypothetical protein